MQPPVELEMHYKGQHLRARIERSGKMTWGDAEYESVSMAAAMARKSIIGSQPGRPYPQTNGWTFWQVAGPDGRMRTLDSVRKAAYEGTRK